MATRKASDSNLTGKKYNDASAGASKIADLPNPPTFGTLTTSSTQVTIPFTAVGTGGTATSFIATSTPGSITGTSSTSPITVTGLTLNTAYTFKISGINASGTGKQSAASTSITPQYLGPTSVDLLLLAGGGNGASGGGGGGGGMRKFTGLSISGGTSYTVTVGAGGGGSSSALSYTAAGGGNANSGSGGAGAGGGWNGPGATTAGSGNTPATTPSQGANGGAGGQSNGQGGGGGGGGASGSTGGGAGGSGGAGTYDDITGPNIQYAGGGGGRTNGYQTTSGGGAGGGGASGFWSNPAGWLNLPPRGGESGVAGRGGGGGGGGAQNEGAGGGGSGIVVLAYANTYADPTSIGAGLTYTKDTSSRSGYKVFTFTAGSDTVVF